MKSEMLTKARQSYLNSINDQHAPKSLLLDLLEQAEKQTPQLFEEYRDVQSNNTMTNDRINWSTTYFDTQLAQSQINFSHNRIKHLIEVREHLRTLGARGFVPIDTHQQQQKQTREKLQILSSHAPSTNLLRFVEEGHLATTRTALTLELNDNSLTSSDLKATIAWTKNKVPHLFESYSEKAFARAPEPHRSLWTPQYYDSQIVYLDTNFSEERLLHLVEVREALRQQHAQGFAPTPSKLRVCVDSSHAASGQAQAHRQNDQSRPSQTRATPPERNPIFGAALLVGGALAALVVFLVALVK